MAGYGAGKGAHPRWVLALLLPVTKHETLGDVPFLYPTDRVFKENRWGVKVLSGGNPVFHSGEGLLYSFGWFPEMWPTAEIKT